MLMSAHLFQFFLTSNGNPSLLSTVISYTPIIFVEYLQNLQKISPVSAHNILMSAHKSLWVLTRSFWVLIPLQMMQICFLTMSQRFISTIEFISYIVWNLYFFSLWVLTKSDPSQHEVLTCFYQPPGVILYWYVLQ